MSRSARVTSIDVLPLLAAALQKFRGEAAGALDDLEIELRRGSEWIHHDRKEYWAQELRRASRSLNQARLQLQQARCLAAIADHEPACIDEKRALERAKRRLETAQREGRGGPALDASPSTGPSTTSSRSRTQFATWLDTDLLAGGRRVEPHERVFGKLYFPGGAGGPGSEPRRSAAPSGDCGGRAKPTASRPQKRDREAGAVKSCDLNCRRRETRTGAEVVSDDLCGRRAAMDRRGPPRVPGNPFGADRAERQEHARRHRPLGRGARRRRARSAVQRGSNEDPSDERIRLSPDAAAAAVDRLAAWWPSAPAVEEAGPRRLRRPQRSRGEGVPRGQRLLDERYRAEKAAAEEEYASTRARGRDEVPVGARRAGEGVRDGPRRRSLARFTADQQAAEQALQDAHWEAMEAADAARGGLNLPLKELWRAWTPAGSSWRTSTSRPWRCCSSADIGTTCPKSPPTGVILEKHPGRRFCHALEQAQAQFRDLSQAVPAAAVPRASAAGDSPPVVARGGLSVVGRVLGWNDWRWAAVSGGVAALVEHRGRRLDLPHRQAAIDRGLSRPAAHPARGRTGAPGRARSGQGRLPAAGRRDHRPPQDPNPEGRRGPRRRHGAASNSASRTTCSRPTASYPKRLADWSPGATGRSRRSRRSILPCSARSKSITPTESQRIRARHDQRAGGEPAAIRARVDRDGRALADAAWSSSARRPSNRAGVPRVVSRLEHRRLEPLDARRRPFRRRSPSATARSSWPRSRTACPRTSGCGPRRPSFTLPIAAALPAPFAVVAEGRRPGPRPGGRRHAERDAAAVDGDAARQGPLHDRRSGRAGRELLGLHAPGRLRRATGGQPHLDRRRPHRAAAGRPDQAHGERHPGLPPQRVPFDRGVQRLRRRDGRAVPGAGGGQLSRPISPRRPRSA